MLRPMLIAVLIALPGVAGAQAPVQNTAEQGTPPARIRSILLEPGKKCPVATGDEIVVCTPIDQPYRIPKGLRSERKIPPAAQSWVNRAATIDEVGRVAGALPNTCSTIGSAGQTGCTLQLLQQWRGERAEQKQDAPQ